MKHRNEINIAIILLLGIIPVFGQMALSMTGGVSETIDRDDLTAGAGSDLASDYISSTSAGSIDISGTSGISWKVQVKKTDGTWDSDMLVYVRRTSDGSGSGTITDGDTYQQITDTYTDLFTGSDDRSSISIQVKMSGMSVSDVGENNYSSSLSFKVIEDAKGGSLLRQIALHKEHFHIKERIQDMHEFEEMPNTINSKRKID